MLPIQHIEIDGPVDVLVEVNSGFSENADGSPQRFRRPVELIPGILSIGPIDRDMGRMIIRACQPAGLNFDPWKRKAKYALVRRLDGIPPQETVLNWDKDGLLQRALCLSRWIRPTAWGLDFAAQVFPDGGPGNELQIVPADCTNINRYAFMPPAAKDDRLTEDDAEQLGLLLRRYESVKETLSPRIKRAMWLHDYVRHTYYLDVAWPLVGAAFEALVNSSKSKVTRQFKTRVAALATAVGEPDMTVAMAESIYEDIRCPLVHGEHAQGLGDAQNLNRFTLAMNVLRKVLRKCVEDSSFSSHFKNEDSIRAWRRASRKGTTKTRHGQ